MGTRMLRWSLVALLTGLVGCGGGGTGNPDPGPGPGGSNGRVSGDLGSDAGGALVRLEGTNQTVVCGPDGTFQFEGVPVGEYTISVETPGGQGGAVSVRVLPGQTTEVPPLALSAAGQISGLVSDLQTGQPIAGARVLARNTPWYPVMADDVPQGVADGLAGGPGRQETEPTTAEPPRVTTTESDGSFRFGGVAPGPYSVEVSIEGYEGGETGTWVEPGRTGVADVMLRRIDPNNATLSGLVTTTIDGTTGPLAQVRVELWPNFDDNGGGPRPLADLPAGGAELDSSSDPFYMPIFLDIWTGFTDEQGGYALRNIPPGEYRLTFRRYGYSDVERTVTLGTAEQRTENALLAYRLTTVTGRVVRPDGSGGTLPVEGAEVWAATWYGMLAMRQNGEQGGGGGSDGGIGTGVYPYPVGPGTAVTDAQGQFSIEVEAGNVSMGAWHPEYGYSYQELTVPLAGLSGVTLLLETFDVVPPDGDGGGGGGVVEPANG